LYIAYAAFGRQTQHTRDVGNNMKMTFERIYILIIMFSFFACQEKSTIEIALNHLGINQNDFVKIDTALYESKSIEKLRFVKSKSEYVDIKFYESGEKKSLIPVKKLQVHGECTDWYKNGVVKWKRYYEYGNSIKQSTTYDKNGLRTKIDDFTDGSFTVFYNNDKPLMKRSDSIYIDYYINGQIKSSFIKKSNSPTIVEYYNEDGNIVFKGTSDSNFDIYKNDSLYTGEITSKFTDGMISYSQKLINGSPDGKCFSKYGNGNLEYELEYEKGNRIGVHKRYYLDGKIKSIKDFNTTEYKEWDEQGNLVK